jgi:hypothetical protein
MDAEGGSSKNESRMNRLVPLLVAFSLVAPPVLEAGHAARVRHVACPVDGQFEDARDESPGIPHSHSAGVVLPSGERTRHTHRPCDATPAARQRATMARAASPVAPGVTRQAPPARADEPRPSAVELYRVAPKLSPPL